MDESIPDIVKDIDCLQETKQHSIKIEHNWSINNIFSLIASKRPGDKIESEQFSYETSANANTTTNNESLFCTKCRESCSCNLTSNKSKKRLISTTLNSSINNNKKKNEVNNVAYSSQLSLNTEILCNSFLENALWRLELNRSPIDSSHVSLSLILMHARDSVPPNEQASLQALLLQQHVNLLLKLKFYLFNSEMNDLFEKQTIEIKINLKCFFDSLFSTCNYSQQSHQHHQNESSTKFVERYTLESFCPIKDLLHWLNKHKSNDFCLITEFKLYVTLNKSQLDSLGTNRLQKSRSKCSLHETPPLPPSSLPNQSILVFNYKHAWIIKHWRHFLMQDSQLHTFMNDTEIAHVLSESKNENKIKFVKFRSKTFSFLNKNASEFSIEQAKIDNLLKNVKWKLQLYPNGYSHEFEQNLSLFVNFSQLTGDLAPFSSTPHKQHQHKSSQNNSKKIEETFYDSNENYGLILLIKSSSSSSQQAGALDSNETSEDQHEPLDIMETFVKASFQISIMDSNGKRVDKCQSEKQLFELLGSWGYKEWLTVKDLNDSKEKYLTNSHSTLNLNCKIVLFYTLTTKITNLSDLDSSLNSNLNLSSSSLALEPTCNALNFSSSSLASSRSSNSSSSSLAGANAVVSTNLKNSQQVKKQNSLSNPLEECNTLVYDLRRMFKNSELYDVIVKSPYLLDTDSEYKIFKVHKLILAARSQVFEKMFSNEKASTCHPFYVNIVDFDARTVEIFLNYLYTDKLEVTKNKLLKLNENEDSDDSLNDLVSNEQSLYMELFKVAEKYSVHRLKQISESKLIKLISSDTCVELLILAYLHNSSRLKLNCFKYLAANVNSIVTQSGWSLLEKNYPSLLAEAFRVLYFKQK